MKRSSVLPLVPIENALAAMDVFLLAGPSEDFSRALVEVWLEGSATVATRVGAVPESERKYGRLVVPIPVNSTPHQLSDDNIETVQRAGEVVRAEYTAIAMAERWQTCFYRIAERRRSSVTAV